jgi:hypothetical protein
MHAYVVAGALLVPALAPLAPQATPPAGRVASIGIDVPRAVTLGEPVVMTLRVLNDSDGAVRATLGFDRVGALFFEAIGPDARRQTGHPQLREGGSRSEAVDVSPRSQYSQRIVVDEWVSFGVVGAHALNVRFLGSLTAGPGVTLNVQRDHVFTVVVLPRDQGRLEELCRSLAGRLELPQGLPEYREAVNELTFVRDPVAIPYSEAMAAREVFAPRLYETLAAIGTPEARQALERLSRHPTVWVAASAKAALARIK